MTASPAAFRAPALVRAIERGGVLETLQAGVALRRRPPGRRELDALVGLLDGGDDLARLTACYVLGSVPGRRAGEQLIRLLDAEEADVRETAALAHLGRAPSPTALTGLRRAVAEGGFGGMLAEVVLEEWTRAGDRAGRSVHAARDAGAGLRVAQVFLQGRIDGELQEAGAGDGGGLATLVVHLSRALGRRPEIDRAFTITRAYADEHAPVSHERRHEPIGDGAAIERIAFGPAGYLASADMWPHRAELERALERRLRALAPLDVVHLRFADVGTFAAARVCRRLGLPVCFTLAADPHAVILSRERAGLLDRDSFGEANRREHFLFRIHLVESMLEQAAGLVLFPRADAAAEVGELLGVSPEARRLGGRFRTIAEGISLETLDEAARELQREGGAPALRDLASAVDALPGSRAGLPLLLSVGRFNRIKGFDRLLEAWAGDDRLFASFNLALVGGDLERPTGEEREVLRRLADVVRRLPRAREGVLLLGHRSHAEVAALLHAARAGLVGSIGANGIYACASDKEEFGLALLEALAVGLPVVAPQAGGPVTYVEDGRTGFLVDTMSVAHLRSGLRAAAEVRASTARAGRATAQIRSRFSVEAMARELAALYVGLSGGVELEAAA